MRPYKPYIPQTPGEVWDLIGSMVLGAPRFIDSTGYFPGKNIDTEFEALTGGIDAIRKKLGEERYAKLMQMAEQTKNLFLAAADYEAEEAWEGRNLLLEMEDVLNEIRRKKPPAASRRE